MTVISYIQKGREDLDLIKPLWEKLKSYHTLKSPNFSQEYEYRSFADRAKFLLKKSKPGALRMDLAYNGQKKLVGYCVSTISPENEGEIDSIYVDEKYQSQGIGAQLMRRSLDWMENADVERKIIAVAVGNEETLSFYRKYGFIPRSIILEQKSNTEFKNKINKSRKKSKSKRKI